MYNPNRSDMKKSLMILAGVTMLFTACNNKSTDSDSISDEVISLNQRLEIAQDTKDSLIFLMSDIYSGIEEINAQEGLLYNLRGSDDNAANRAEIQDNLQRIKASLLDKQNRLDTLTAQLNKNNDKNGALAQEIVKLKQLISEKESKITELQNALKDANLQISQLNDKVAVTEEKVKEETAAKEQAQAETQQAQAETQQAVNDLNRVYYAIGTSKELKARDIVETKFLGKTKVLQGNFDMSYFTAADKRSLRSIPCHNKSVKILTSQPQDSYRIVENPTDKTKIIEITNPARFWGTSDFLVIRVG